MTPIHTTVGTIVNFGNNLAAIDDKNKKTGWIHALYTPSESYRALRNYVSEPLANGAVYCIKSTGLLTTTTSSVSLSCAKKFYEKTNAKKAVSTLGNSLFNAFLENPTVKNTTGSLGQTALKVFGSWVGKSAEEVMLQNVSEQVFSPVVSVLLETIYKNGIQVGLNLAIDSGLLYAVDGLNVVSNYKNLIQVLTVAEKVATAARIGAFTYVYGPPVYQGTKLVVQCASLNARKKQIHRILNETGVSEPLKSAMVIILMTCMDSIALRGIDLNVLLRNQDVLNALCKAAALSMNIKKAA